ncbi:MAG: hypothetical protein LBH24_02150 [Clostridiales bacterium]|jgi:hypothetical protein|nr:hypothetical protein [Clostridiales bacterium]
MKKQAPPDRNHTKKDSPAAKNTSANAQTPQKTAKKKVKLRGKTAVTDISKHTPAKRTAKYKMLEPDKSGPFNTSSS